MPPYEFICERAMNQKLISLILKISVDKRDDM